jgi:hypothetical protein
MPILPYALIMVATGTLLLSKSKNKNWLIAIYLYISYTFAIHAELRMLPFSFTKELFYRPILSIHGTVGLQEYCLLWWSVMTLCSMTPESNYPMWFLNKNAT